MGPERAFLAPGAQAWGDPPPGRWTLVTFPGEEKHGSRRLHAGFLFLTLWMEHTVTVCDAVSGSFQQHHLCFTAHEAASQVSGFRGIGRAVRLGSLNLKTWYWRKHVQGCLLGPVCPPCADTTQNHMMLWVPLFRSSLGMAAVSAC